MLDQKVLDVLTMYEETLKKKGHKPEKIGTDLKSPGPSGDGDHTYWMCVKTREFLTTDLAAAEEGPAKEKVRQKAHRWLGWVQAKLNTLGFFSVDQMRDHNRSNGELPPEAPMDKVLREVRAERAVQDAQWGGPSHDDAHPTSDFLDYIAAKTDLARGETNRPDKTRTRLIQVAALAVAAIESLDRKAQTG